MNPSIPEPFLVGAAFLYGLLFGSFANVCIYRLPRDRSVIWPRSACPGCGRPIRWFDNVPVLSWILLLGRCRDCRSPISPRYPLVETTVGAIFALAVARHPGQWVEAGAEALFGWILVVLVFTDFDLQILPDQLTLGGIVAGLALAPWRTTVDLRGAAIGAAAGGGVLLAIASLYSFVRKREGMGLGDVKMLAAIGAFLGWKGVVVAMALGGVAGSMVGVLLVLRGLSLRDTKIPFGVFLGLGALAALYSGDLIGRFYGL